MWGYYADSQKGFAIEYDFRPTLQTPLPYVLMCPVIYSENRYDATDYMTWAFLKMQQLPVISTDISAHIKVALHKSKNWCMSRSGGWLILVFRTLLTQDQRSFSIDQGPSIMELVLIGSI